jgi:hypothetical protein
MPLPSTTEPFVPLQTSTINVASSALALPMPLTSPDPHPNPCYILQMPDIFTEQWWREQELHEKQRKADAL